MVPWEDRVAHYVPIVEQIVARHVAAALIEAADAIGAVRSGYVTSGGEPDLLPSTVPHAERAGYLQGLQSAARIVRNRAAPP